MKTIRQILHMYMNLKFVPESNFSQDTMTEADQHVLETWINQ